MKRWLFNKSLRILLITNGLILLAGAMLGPIYAIFVERIGGSLLDASLAGGFFALAAGVITLVSGSFVDKTKKNYLIVVSGYVIIGIGFLLYIFINSIWSLFAVQILIGSAEAFYSPAFDALYSKHTSKKKIGKEWGTWEAIQYFSIAIGAAIGGFIASSFGFNLLFIVMAVLCFISALYMLFRRK